MVFKTKTGSTYEVDFEDEKIRRLYGKSAPTTSVGQDGDWRSYHSISDIVVGHSVIIIWDESEPNKATWTSSVVEVDPILH